jgi:hypothetical protein
MQRTARRRSRSTGPRNRRRCPSTRKFSSTITGARRLSRARTAEERIVLELLDQYDYPCGLRAVTLQARRPRSRNGKVSRYTLGIHVVTDHGVIFIETADEFTSYDTAVLRFITEHYRLPIIRLTHARVQQMKANPELLLSEIVAAEAELKLIGRTQFTDRFWAAITRADQPEAAPEMDVTAAMDTAPGTNMATSSPNEPDPSAPADTPAQPEFGYVHKPYFQQPAGSSTTGPSQRELSMMTAGTSGRT